MYILLKIGNNMCNKTFLRSQIHVNSEKVYYNKLLLKKQKVKTAVVSYNR